MDYRLMVADDVVNFLDANPLARELSPEDLYNDLYDEPSIVDVGASLDSATLQTMIVANIDIALDACDWLGIDALERFRKLQAKDWKWFDKNIRRYVLREVVGYDL